MGRAKPVRRAAPRVAVEIDTEALRRQFQEFRAASGLSQAAAARLLGLSQATVSDFERGKFAAVRARTLLAVRELLAEWGEKTAHGRPIRRVVPAVAEAVIEECLWCGAPLPQMQYPARFCPLCGGRQSSNELRRGRCCSGCGRPDCLTPHGSDEEGSSDSLPRLTRRE